MHSTLHTTTTTTSSPYLAAATNSSNEHLALTRVSAAARAFTIASPPPPGPLAGGPSRASCCWMAWRRPLGLAPRSSATFCCALRGVGRQKCAQEGD